MATNVPTILLLRSGATRFVALAVLWLVLTEGDLGALWLGALAVVAATLASLVLLPPAGHAWSPLGSPAPMPYNLYKPRCSAEESFGRACR